LRKKFEEDSINQIARKCKIAPNGTLKILKKFEREGILKFKKIANIKYRFGDLRDLKSITKAEP